MLVQRGSTVYVEYDNGWKELDLFIGHTVSLNARQTERLIKSLQRGLAKFPRQKPRKKKA